MIVSTMQNVRFSGSLLGLPSVFQKRYILARQPTTCNDPRLWQADLLRKWLNAPEDLSQVPLIGLL